MAKGINIKEYRGLKVHRYKKVVMHLTDDKKNKLHVRFPWDLWQKLTHDITTPVVEHMIKTIRDFEE
jgi:hypothetical protein